MFGTIQINQVVFFAAVNTLRAQGGKINSGVQSFPECKSKSTVISEYKTQYTALKKVLKDYQTLFLRDIGKIQEAGNTLVKVENQILK